MATSDDYYARKTVQHIDGTPIFETEEDRRAKAEVAKAVGEAWGCEFNDLGHLAPVDWWISQFGRIIGYAEIKARTHAKEKKNEGAKVYKTVFLNLRKFLALLMATAGTGKPSCFIVRFEDGVFWIPLTDVDAHQLRIGGCRHVVKSKNDVEPVIEVPCDKLKRLEDSPFWIPPNQRTKEG